MSQTPVEHEAVLRDEVVNALVSERDGVYVDATFGRGGHSRALLAALASEASLVAIDRDAEAVHVAHELAVDDRRIKVAHSRFSLLGEVLEELRFSHVAGVMFDTGVSSPQLNTPERGFSFTHVGPLDMRMDATSGVTAATWLNESPESEIARVIREYGEDKRARRLAKAIVAARPLRTTHDLVQVVQRTPGPNDKHKHPATRVFQAIRIHVNDELKELEKGLIAAFDLLLSGGRLAVLTFHSLEHRIVKRLFRSWCRPTLPRRLPVPGNAEARARWTVRSKRPSVREVNANPRARSAMLQVLEHA